MTTTCPTPITSFVYTNPCPADITANASNQYTSKTCSALQNTGNVAVQNCNAQTPDITNDYTKITCSNPTGTNYSSQKVVACASQTAAANNSWISITCPTPTTTAATPVQSCTAAAASSTNGYVSTSCSYPGVTNYSNSAVASCTSQTAASNNNWIGISCAYPLATNYSNQAVVSCTPQTGDITNSYITITCPPPVVTSGPAASCIAADPVAGNSYVKTTCPTPITTTNVAVASCTASGATLSNNYITTTCPAPIVSAQTPVQTCTPQAATSDPNFVSTACIYPSSTNYLLQPVQTCVAQTADSTNNWVGIYCVNVTTTNVPVQSCTPVTASAPSWITTTCPQPVVTTNVPVASCAASAGSSSNSWVTTTCPTPVTTGPTPTATCTPVSPVQVNSYVATTCSTTTVTNKPVASCIAATADNTNQYINTTCSTNNTTNVPVQSCTSQTGGSTNSWLTVTCGTNNTSNVPVASCTQSSPTSGNNWVTTTCPTANVTGPTPVLSCSSIAASQGNAYVATTCDQVTTNNVPVPSCTPSSASPDQYITTTCGVNNTTNVPVATCTPAAAASGNYYTTTTCVANNTYNSAVTGCVPSGPTQANGYITVTCTGVSTFNVPVAACNAAGPSSANGFTTVTCPTPVRTGPSPVANCTPTNADATNSYTWTSCSTNNTSNVPVTTCTAATATSSNSWTTTSCPSPVVTTDVPTASCSAGAASSTNNYTSTTCRTVTSGPTLTSICSATAANSGNNYVATACGAVSGEKAQQKTTTTVSTTQYEVTSPSTSTDSAYSDVDSVCYVSDTLPSNKPTLSALLSANPAPTPPAGCNGWPCTVNAGYQGSTDSLADVAQYYYITDLRPDLDDNVKTTGTGPEDDRAKWQHMVTFSIGLGVSGTLNYQSDYKSATTGDFAQIRGQLASNPNERFPTKVWPQWPDPALNYGDKNNWNDARSIDDFWHAAVNGRGQFFSARSPKDVVQGIGGALSAIRTGTVGAPSSTASPSPTLGNNLAFIASYLTRKWTGDVQAREINLTTGAVSSTITWAAQDNLDAAVGPACDNRNIFLIRGGATNNLVNFSSNSMRCDSSLSPTGAPDNGLSTAEMAYFGSSQVALLGQYPLMTDGTLLTPDQRSAAAGANFVNFLRGQRGQEGFDSGVANKLYRTRDHVLGDVVSSAPVYVGAPSANYTDEGYADFKTAKASRTKMVYAGANDGMLHAFYASATDVNAGKEAWAIIPTAVLPKLYRLADYKYEDSHEYYVDGQIAVGDARDGSTWKTLLVGGLNYGGKGYYAVDVTDPGNPKALWEFKWSATCYDANNPTTAGADCHLGYSFGRPLLSKLADGRWVVFVTSGYNNVNNPTKTGDGKGYLYVLNAFTGQIIYKISTGAGDDGSAASSVGPSGLAQVANWIDDSNIDNTTLRLYGGDLLGNIWRFDVNDTIDPSGREATLIGVAKDYTGAKAQPITAAPELAKLNSKPMVFVGTGRLLGVSDLSDTTRQSVYAIVDPMLATQAYSDLRGSLKQLKLTQVGTGASAIRTAACSGDRCDGANGWVVDLPDSGERVNVDMVLQNGTLVVGSNVPGSNACDLTGYSFLNSFDYATGEAVATATSGQVSKYLTNSLLVGITTYTLPSRAGQAGAGESFVKPSAAAASSQQLTEQKVAARITPPVGKRTTWREISVGP